MLFPKACLITFFKIRLIKILSQQLTHDKSFMLQINFLYVKGPFYLMIQLKVPLQILGRNFYKNT